MTAVTHVYEDRWGAIIDHAGAGFVEIRWYDTTSAMSVDEFQQWLTNFAAEVERLRRPGILVDATRFLFDPAKTSAEWWYANIVPRYNAAGVKKFAFHMPEGMPEVGSPPEIQGPAAFLTAYFAQRQAALDWLASATPPTAR
jgi:uncharacterized protein YodC (DUF2158 family)